MLWVLFTSLFLLGYAFVGYPVLIWVGGGGGGGGVWVGGGGGRGGGGLPRKVGELLELAKREPIREIWVGLDGCTDGTGERVREELGKLNIQCSISNVQVGRGRGESRFLNQEAKIKKQDSISNDQYPISNIQCSSGEGEGGPIVYVVEFEKQRGKAAVLNELMGRAGQAIWVMMDARQRVEEGAIGKLLENFADPQVGVVSGALVYESAKSGVQKGAESYWGYEKWIRESESRVWAVPGATGALYAIRRELCEPIPENTLVDDVLIPMRAVLKGFRCLFEPSARVFDLPSARFDQEGLRKRRTLAGIWQLMRLEPRIFSPFANPIWFQFISHKFLRLLTPFFVFLALFSSGIYFWWILFAILASGMAYFLGKRVRSRLLGLLGAFFGVNVALLRAAWDAGTGRFEARWKVGAPR